MLNRFDILKMMLEMSDDKNLINQIICLHLTYVSRWFNLVQINYIIA